MDLNLKSFIEVFSFEVSWLEANLLWVFLSSVIYLTLVGFFLNAIRLSIEYEIKNRLENRLNKIGRGTPPDAVQCPVAFRRAGPLINSKRGCPEWLIWYA